MAGSSSWIPSFSSSDPATSWDPSPPTAPSSSQKKTLASHRRKIGAAPSRSSRAVQEEAEAEAAMAQREARLKQLALEAQLSLNAFKIREDEARISSLEAERTAQAAAVQALEAALEAARRSAAEQGALAMERVKCLEEEAGRRAQGQQGSAATAAAAEQLPVLQAELRRQALEYEQLLLSNQALQAQAAAAQLRAEEASQQLQQREEALQLQLKQQHESHEAHVADLHRKTARLIAAPATGAGSGAAPDQAVQEQVMALLTKLYADEIGEEEAAQQLATLKCDMGLLMGPDHAAAPATAVASKPVPETAPVTTSVPETLPGQGAATAKASGGAEAKSGTAPRPVPVVSLGAPPPLPSYAFKPQGFILADPQRLMRLISRASQIKGGSAGGAGMPGPGAELPAGPGAGAGEERQEVGDRARSAGGGGEGTGFDSWLPASSSFHNRSGGGARSFLPGSAGLWGLPLSAPAVEGPQGEAKEVPGPPAAAPGGGAGMPQAQAPEAAQKVDLTVGVKAPPEAVSAAVPAAENRKPAPPLVRKVSIDGGSRKDNGRKDGSGGGSWSSGMTAAANLLHALGREGGGASGSVSVSAGDGAPLQDQTNVGQGSGGAAGLLPKGLGMGRSRGGMDGGDEEMLGGGGSDLAVTRRRGA